MWVFEQNSGRLYQDTDPETVFLGYSGHLDGKNSHAHEHIKNMGPCPCGHYQISGPYDSPDHGPYCLRLTPAPENEMWGRSAMLIHGDSKALPGHASHGCLIFSRGTRQTVWTSGDHLLRVIPG